MPKVLVTEEYLEDIADAIRAKNGTQNKYKPSQMADAIDEISGGGTTPSGTKEISITQNGTTTEDVTNYASAEINVNVSAPSPTLQTKTVTPSESTQNVSADNGYDGLSQVTVNPIPSGYVQPSGSLSITDNDTYDVSQYASAVVNVSGGGGGSGITKTTGTVTGNGTNTIAIPTAKSPDVAYVYRSDIDSMTAVSDRAAAATVYWDGGVCGSMYTAASSTTLSNSGTAKNSGTGSTSTPAVNAAGYTNGTFYLKSGNNSNLWSSSLTYAYVFIFFS